MRTHATPESLLTQQWINPEKKAFSGWLEKSLNPDSRSQWHCGFCRADFALADPIYRFSFHIETAKICVSTFVNYWDRWIKCSLYSCVMFWRLVLIGGLALALSIRQYVFAPIKHI